MTTIVLWPSNTHGQATPMAKQHWALVLSLFAPWISVVQFSIGPVLCAVCAVRSLCFEMRNVHVLCEGS